VDNVAAAVGLAVADPRSSGRVFNVAAKETPTESEWVKWIGDTCGWTGEIVVAPTESLPSSMRSPLAIQQDVVVSSERIRSELGYAEPVRLGEGLRRTVEWTRENPPTTERIDYSIEDRVLAALAP
jgi:nucleoside-diphosphate-sugar epimerase